MMAVTSLQLRPIPPRLLPARNGCTGTGPRMAPLSCRYNQSTNVQGRTRLRSHVTRRDALSFMSSALLAALFMVAGAAEARTSRLENKKKALEKLREKASVQKEKNGATGAKKMPPRANLLIARAAVEASF